MVKKLPLQTGEYALVDDEDYERCKEYVWMDNRIGKITAMLNKRPVSLARFIMNPPKNRDVIRLGGRLDFRKENLSVVDPVERVYKNRSKTGSTSMYKGVSWSKDRNKWMASITVEGKARNLGGYQEEWEAAKAYNKAAYDAWGESAFLNRFNSDSRSEKYADKERIKNRRSMHNSNHRGVSYDGERNKSNPWKVYCKTKYVGCYSTIEEAKLAYDQSAWEYWQEQAVLHYPENISAYKEGAYRKEKAGK